MKRKDCLFLYLALFIFSAFNIKADQDISEQDQVDFSMDVIDIDLEAKRALLPVPDAVNLTSRPEYTYLITPAALGKTTKEFSCCKVFQLTRSLKYSPSSSDGPMINMTGKGATFDMLHNCVNFDRTGTVTNCIGIEVGDALGTSLPLDTVTIENGIMTNWDIAIVVHAGVRNVVLKNLVLTGNTIPIALLGTSDDEVTTVYMENVYIVGSNEERLSSLQWIRSKITDGTDFGGGTTTNNYGYNDYDHASDPTMGLSCNPLTDTVASLPIYTGVYANYVANMQMKNVTVSNIGCDLDIGTSEAEDSGAYGIWLTNCSSTFMEDVESTKTRSGAVAVGAFFDNCNVTSIKKANITNTFVADVEATPSRVNCKSGRWAAAITLKDCNNFYTEDVELSNTAGQDRSWGVRTILNPVTGSNSFNFENVRADYLRGNEVIGFDLGDTLRSNATGDLPTGAMRHLTMKNVSISSARGPDKSDPEDEIATFFKGIHLGDNSKDLDLGNVKIQSNLVATTATGICSGIEFGSLSTTTNVPAGSGKAFGSLENLNLKDVSISGNIGGNGILASSFAGIRAVSTGTVAPHAVGANDFKNIKMQNVDVNHNTFDGLRAINDSGSVGDITITNLDIADSQFSHSVNGMNVENGETLQIQNSKFVENSASGISFETIGTASMKNLLINNNKGLAADSNHDGFSILTSADSIKGENITVNGNSNFGINVASVKHFELDGFNASSNISIGVNISGTSESVILKNGVVANINVGVAGVNSYGIQLDTVNNLKMDNVAVKSIASDNGHSMGINVITASSIVYLTNIDISGISTSGVNDNSIGLHLIDVEGGILKNIIINDLVSTQNTFGMQFESSGSPVPSAKNLDLEDIFIGNATALVWSVCCEMNGGDDIRFKNINFSGFTLGSVTVGLHLACLAAKGFNSIDIDGFRLSNQIGDAALGLWVSGSSLTNDSIRPVTALSLKNGIVNNNVSSGNICSGIRIDRSTAPANIGASGIVFENISSTENRGINSDASGIYVNNAEMLSFKNINASNNSASGTGTCSVYGVLLETAVDNLKIENMVVNNNRAGTGVTVTEGSAYGLLAESVSVVHADGITANDNIGGGNNTNAVTVVAGIMFFDSLGSGNECSILNNLQACGNRDAYRTYGIFLDNPIGVSMSHIDASSNKSNIIGQVGGDAIVSQAIGLFLLLGSSVTVDDLHASVNEQDEIDPANLALDTDGGTAEDVANTSVDIARNFPVASRSGAYGLLVDGTTSFKLDGAITKENRGVRAFGVLVRDADHPHIKNVESSENEAIGAALNDTIVAAIADVTDITVPTNQENTIFGGVTTATSVDLQAAYKSYLRALSVLRTDTVSVGSTSFCDNVTTGTASGSIFAVSHNIIQATIAQYRRFSTSVGIGILNSNGATIDGCQTIGNHSLSDSAAGIAIYGDGNKGHIVKDCKCGRNQAWTESASPDPHALGDIDISAWRSLYTKLDLAYLSVASATPYTTTNIPATITSAMIGFKPTDTQKFSESSMDWELRNRRLSVEFAAAADATILYDFTSVGPISAGIVLERQRDAHVIDNYAYSNHGNGALGFGIFSDATASSMFMDNKAISNESDYCGHAWGIVDCAYSTANCFFRNLFHGNRDDINLNSPLMIIFDSTVSASQVLPIQTIQPGSVEALAKASSVDNISIEYVGCKQQFNGLSDNVRTYLNDQSITTGDTPPSNYTGC